MRLCDKCWDIYTQNHVCPSNEKRYAKEHILKTLEKSKLDKYSETPLEHLSMAINKMKKGKDKEKKEITGKEGKRPLNSYMKFSKKMRDELKKTHPDTKTTEISKIIGSLWRELSDTEKAKYK